MGRLSVWGVFGVLVTVFWGSCRGTINDGAGIKMRINDAGLETTKEILTDLLEASILKMTIPNLVDDEGSFKYNLSRISIHKFTFGNTLLKTSSPNVITVGVKNANLSSDGDFYASQKVWIFTLTTDGTFMVNASGISILQSLIIGKDDHGRPNVTSGNCSASIDNISIRVSGTALDGLVNTFIENSNDEISELLGSSVCSFLKVFLDGKAKELIESVPVTFPISQLGTSVNFTLVSPPAMDATSIKANLSGRSFPTNNPLWGCDVSNSSLPLHPPTDRMFQVMIDESRINCLLQSINYNNFFNIKFTVEQVTKLVSFDVRSSLVLFIPSLSNYVGRPLQIIGYPSDEPEIQIHPEYITICMNYTLVVQVISVNNNWVDVATINMTFKANIDFNITNNLLIVRFQKLSLKIVEADGADATVLQSLADLLFSQLVVINKNLIKQEFELTSIYNLFSLHQPRLYKIENVIVVESNVTLATGL